MQAVTVICYDIQHVSVVDGATNFKKDGVEGSNGGSLKDGTEAFVLILCGTQLVLRSIVLTALHLNDYAFSSVT